VTQVGTIDVVVRSREWLRSTRARRWVPLGLFVGAALLRAILALNLPMDPLLPDHREYMILGRNLVEHGYFGFGPDWASDPELAGSSWKYLYSENHAIRYGPGFPAVLGVLRLTLGPNERLHQGVMILLSAVTVVMVYQIGRSLFGPEAGAAAGLLALLAPATANAMTKMGREPLLSLLFVVGFVLVIRIYQNQRLRDGVLAGLWFGAAAYCKETVTMAGGLAGLWLLWQVFRGQRKLLAPALAMAVCTVLLIAPWMIRNAVAYERLVGFTNVSGWLFIDGTVDRNWLANLSDADRDRFDPKQAADPVEGERILMQMVLTHAQEQPMYVLSRAFGNSSRFWSPLPGRRNWFGGSEVLHSMQIAAIGFYLGVFALAFFGFYRFRHRPETQLVLVILIGITALHAFVWNYPRYRLPYDNLLFVYAGASIQMVLGWRRSTEDV
jgi:hypothetical protein